MHSYELRMQNFFSVFFKILFITFTETKTSTMKKHNTLLLKKLCLTLVIALNITSLKAANFYWVGGTGNWSDFANHWVTTSGGTTFYTYAPTLLDNVFFDGNSFSTSGQRVTPDITNIQCNNFTWTNTIPDVKFQYPAVSNKVVVMGSFLIGANTNLSGNTFFSFESINNGNTITMLDTLQNEMVFYGAQGGWDLMSPVYANIITFKAGTINTNNYDLTFRHLKTYSMGPTTRIFNAGTSSLNVIGNQNSGGPANQGIHLDGTVNFTGNNNDITFNANLASLDSSSIIFPIDYFDVYAELWLPNFTFGNLYINGLENIGSYRLLYSINSASADTVGFNNLYLHNTNFTFNPIVFSCDSILSTGSIGMLGVGAYGSININYAFGNYVGLGGSYNSTIKKIEATKDLSLGFGLSQPNSPGPVTVNEINCGGTATISCILPTGSVEIGKCKISGNATFAGTLNFDTLLLGNNSIQTFANTGTFTVNNYFAGRGSPGKLLQMKSSTAGTQATLTLAQSSFCSDYMYIKDMNIGCPNAIAGANSFDAGNNTGWSFTSCSSSSNVWPGDANYDLTVNNLDLLNIGLTYNETGPVRASGSTTYAAQPADDWGGYFISTANYKHADTNGDGIVNANDTLAIHLNYGLSHPFRIASVTNDSLYTSALRLKINMPPTLIPGNTYTIPVTIGDQNHNVNGIYGIALNLNYNQSAIVPGSISISYANSLMDTIGNLSIQNNISGSVQSALTRTNHTNASGSGTIAEITFMVSPSVTGPVNFSFDNIKAVDANGIPLPLGGESSSTPTGISNLNAVDYFILYPNPNEGMFTISYNTTKTFNNTLQVFDLMGKCIYNTTLVAGSNTKQVTLNSIAKGLYVCKVGNDVVRFMKE